MCCVHHCFSEISDQCLCSASRGCPSQALWLWQRHAATSSDKTTFCHSLSSCSHASSLLVPDWDGWMDARVLGARRKEKGKRETFMCYVRNIPYSVFRIRWCRNTLALLLTHLAPCVLILWAFFRSIQSLLPSLSSPLGSHRPCKVFEEGRDREQEGGRKANGGTVERTGLK